MYPVTFAQLVFNGAPTRVLGTQHLGDTGVDMTFSALLLYDAGHSAQISSGFESAYVGAEVVGTAARLEVTSSFFGDIPERRLVLHPYGGTPQQLDPTRELRYLGEVDALHAAALDGISPPFSLEHSRQHLATELALYESAHTGRIVPVLAAGDDVAIPPGSP